MMASDFLEFEEALLSLGVEITIAIFETLMDFMSKSHLFGDCEAYYLYTFELQHLRIANLQSYSLVNDSILGLSEFSVY